MVKRGEKRKEGGREGGREGVPDHRGGNGVGVGEG